MPKFVLLATDLALYFQMLVLVLYVRHALRTPLLRQSWRYVQRDGAAMSAAVVLVVFLLIALLDSVHFRPRLPPPLTRRLRQRSRIPRAPCPSWMYC